MKILSLITHSHVIPNQTRKTFVHLRNTNYDIFDAFFEPSDPPIDSKGPNTIKVQKRSKDIVKIIHVTSVVQL